MRKLLAILLILFLSSSAWATSPVRETRSTSETEYYQREWRFNKGTSDICFGGTDCPFTWGVTPYYVDAMRYLCSTGGTANKIMIRTGNVGSGTCRMGVYSDNGGDPNALLWEGTDQSWSANTWVEEAVTGLTVNSGTYYWLAFKTSASQQMCYTSGNPANSHRYIGLGAGHYSDSFPDPWGASSANNNQYSMQLCVPGGVSDVYSGKFPRGIGRGIVR